jgi:hypothetical protein
MSLTPVKKNCLKVFIIYHNWPIATTGLTECRSVVLCELAAVQLVTVAHALRENILNK